MVWALCAADVDSRRTEEGRGGARAPLHRPYPTDLRFLPDGRALAAEQAGQVVLLTVGAAPEVVLDLRERTGCCGERGLLSLALPPDFSGNGLCFLYGCNKSGDTGLSRVTLGPETLAGRARAPNPCSPLPNPARLIMAGSFSKQPGGVCACDVEAYLKLSQPTVSHHMKLLVQAGFVTAEKRGRWVFYALDPAAFGELGVQLSRFEGVAAA